MPKEKHSPKSQGGRRTRKILLLLGAGALVGGALYFGRKKKAPSTPWVEEFDEKPTPTVPGPRQGGSKPKDDGFPLSIGSRGNRVRLIQQALNRAFGEKLKVDGDWGPLTEAAMKRAHKKAPLLVPSTIVTQTMYARLEKLFAEGEIPTLSGPGFMTEAIQDTVVWDSEGKLEHVRRGTVIGSHLSTIEGIAEIRTIGGRVVQARAADVMLR